MNQKIQKLRGNKEQMKANLVWVLGAFLFAGCGGTREEKKEAPAPVFDIAPVKDYIGNVNKTYGLRFKTSDSALYADRYCTNAVALPPEAPAVRGRDSIRSYYYSNGANRGLEIVITAEQIYGSAELVVEEGVYDFPDGKGGSFDKGKFIALWKQEEGKWKLFREIWNSDKKAK